MGFFDRLKKGLSKTRKALVEKVEQIVLRRKKIDEEMYEELEEALIQADVGVNTAMELVEKIRQRAKEANTDDASMLKVFFQEELKLILGEDTSDININEEGLTVISVVGVNGVGKTTTIGKLAHYFKQQGKKVMLAAADTFRAAAIDQLEIWAKRADAEIIKHSEGADPGAVVYDAVHATRARKMDILIIDTAGRLHTKSNLMEELKKINRIAAREIKGAPHETLLVLDATTGQNAINQAKIFGEAVNVTGIVLTKLDGTAKGGVVIAIKNDLKIPVKMIGVGEKIDDLQPFNPKEFAFALYSGADSEQKP